MKHPGVWCCEKMLGCRFKCSPIHVGLNWGTFNDPQNEVWRKWHDKECGGKLIQLLPPSNDNKITDAELLDFVLQCIDFDKTFNTNMYENEPIRDIIARALIKERDAKIASEGQIMTFTPGPWKVFTEKNKDIRIIAVRDAPCKVNVAIIPLWDVTEPSHEEIDTANLIVTAPELLEALIQCAARFREYEQIHLAKPDKEKAERNAKMAEIAEKAIAKAKG